MGSPYFEAYASNAADLYDAVREQVLDLPTPVVFVVLLSGSIFVVVVVSRGASCHDLFWHAFRIEELCSN